MVRYKKNIGSLLFDILNYTFLVLLCLTMLYPFVYMLSVSISDFDQITLGRVKLFPKGPIQFLTYRVLFSTQDIPRALFNSILYTLTGVFFVVFVSTLTAYVLTQKKLPYRKTMTFFVVLTMFVPGGMIPMFLLVKGIGLYNTLLAVTLPQAFSAWYILIIRSNIDATISQELYDAGYIDGAGNWWVYFAIVLPLIKPIIATIGLFSAVSYWNDFFSPLLYLNETQKYPLTIILRKILLQDFVESYHTGHPTQAGLLKTLGFGYLKAIKYTVIIVAIWPIIVVYPFVQRYFVKGILIGSLKG